MALRLILPGLVLLAGLLAGCSSQRAPQGDNLLTVTLPDGRQIVAEVMTSSADLMRGMMFRDALAPDRGMLFVHPSPGKYSYWMFQCLIPLDIIWMDTEKRIVEVSADTPPCKTDAKNCPSYGGHQEAQFVLELAGGMAAKYGLKTGDTIRF